MLLLFRVCSIANQRTASDGRRNRLQQIHRTVVSGSALKWKEILQLNVRVSRLFLGLRKPGRSRWTKRRRSILRDGQLCVNLTTSICFPSSSITSVHCPDSKCTNESILVFNRGCEVDPDPELCVEDNITGVASLTEDTGKLDLFFPSVNASGDCKLISEYIII